MASLTYSPRSPISIDQIKVVVQEVYPSDISFQYEEGYLFISFETLNTFLEFSFLDKGALEAFKQENRSYYDRYVSSGIIQLTYKDTDVLKSIIKPILELNGGFITSDGEAVFEKDSLALFFN